MTDIQQLMREIEQTSDELVQTVLDFLHQLKATRKNHPLAKFAGILSDTEAAAMRRSIADFFLRSSLLSGDFLSGLEDKVVPPNQAKRMVEVL